MASPPPLTQVTLTATSVADDLGYVALADLADTIHDAPAGRYRIIGGHMVTALVARWGLGGELDRETRDTDLGAPPAVITGHQVVERLTALGYERVEGNRFARTVSDVPVRLAGAVTMSNRTEIDVLVPAYTSKPRQNRRVADNLVTTEVPGLASALQRPPITLDMDLHRLNGQKLHARLNFPDEVSALVLKAFATSVRMKGTDIIDVWRCLEIAFAAGVGPEAFANGEQAEAAALIRKLLAHRNTTAMKTLIDEQRLSPMAADQRHTRLTALVGRVVGPHVA